MSRLSIEVSSNQHQRIKALAALKGKSIKDYVLEKILPASEGDDAWEELNILLTTRVAEAEQGKVSSKTTTQIIEEEIARTVQ